MLTTLLAAVLFTTDPLSAELADARSTDAVGARWVYLSDRPDDGTTVGVRLIETIAARVETDDGVDLARATWISPYDLRSRPDVVVDSLVDFHIIWSRRTKDGLLRASPVAISGPAAGQGQPRVEELDPVELAGPVKPPIQPIADADRKEKTLPPIDPAALHGLQPSPLPAIGQSVALEGTRFTTEAIETLQVPAGEFRCVRLRCEFEEVGGVRLETRWIAPTAGVVQAVNEMVTLRLTEFRDGPPPLQPLIDPPEAFGPAPVGTVRNYRRIGPDYNGAGFDEAEFDGRPTETIRQTVAEVVLEVIRQDGLVAERCGETTRGAGLLGLLGLLRGPDEDPFSFDVVHQPGVGYFYVDRTETPQERDIANLEDADLLVPWPAAIGQQVKWNTPVRVVAIGWDTLTVKGTELKCVRLDLEPDTIEAGLSEPPTAYGQWWHPKFGNVRWTEHVGLVDGPMTFEQTLILMPAVPGK